MYIIIDVYRYPVVTSTEAAQCHCCWAASTVRVFMYIGTMCCHLVWPTSCLGVYYALCGLVTLQLCCFTCSVVLRNFVLPFHVRAACFGRLGCLWL